jgi:hypothetical protein
LSTNPLDLFGDLFSPEEKSVIQDAIVASKPELKPFVKKPKPEEKVRELGEISREPVKTMEGAIQNSGVEVDPNTKELLVPQMTEDETSANKPAYGKHLLRVRPPKGVPLDKFQLCVSNAFALYQLSGNFDVDKVVERSGLTPGLVGKVLRSEQFTVALRARGVHVDPEIRGLTTEQEQALVLLTDPTAGPLKAKLKALGWSYSKYQAQFKHPAFKEAMEGITEHTLAQNSDSLVVLEALALNGDLNAIKYKHLLNGTYDPNRQNNIDIMAVISTVFEIVAKHVRDPEILQALGSELGAVAKSLSPAPTQRLLEN